jgi:uncharacterized protein YqjF (DUF2071 family)
VLLTFTARHLLLATWQVSPDGLDRDLPPGVTAALTAGGKALVSLAAFRNEGVRLDGRPAPSFRQLNVRTYVRRSGETGVLFLSLRVTLAGMGGALFGAPVRPARIRVGETSAEARGLGVSLRYRLTGNEADVPAPADVPLGTHEVGYFTAAGLRRVIARHDPMAWQEAELVQPARADHVLALGFDVGEPDSLLYAASTPFRVEWPPEKVA